MTLAILEQAAERHEQEIDEYINDEEEQGKEGYVDIDSLMRWQGQLNERLQTVRGQMGAGASFTPEDINARQGLADRVYLVLVALANIRRTLNDSLESVVAVKKNLQEKALSISQKLAVKEAQQSQKRQEQAAARRPGLGKKWGVYNKGLQHKEGQTVFRQFVPAGAESIQRALRSQSILDAVYHKDKAFWISTERYELGSSAGKTMMRYVLTEQGARSLMEDYLICASSDFEKDNDQPYTGETSCPFHTLWKPNELGAYGVGAERLKELAPSVVSIEAFSADGTEIEVKADK